MEKRKLTVTVKAPEDWDAFHEHVAEVVLEAWKSMCPKELQLQALERAMEIIKSQNRE